MYLLDVGPFSNFAAGEVTLCRSSRFILGLVFLLSSFAGTAYALDWGWGGWGNWVDTPEGSLARGMGQYYTGAGIYNKMTAIGDSINADTMMRWNEYMYEAHLEATRRMVAKRRGESARINTARHEILKTLQENPSAETLKTAMRSMRRSPSLATRGFPVLCSGSQRLPSKRATSATSRFAMLPKR